MKNKDQHKKWEEHFVRLEAEGLTMAEYARRYSVPLKRLYAWRRKLRPPTIVSSKSKLVKVNVSPAENLPTQVKPATKKYVTNIVIKKIRNKYRHCS